MPASNPPTNPEPQRGPRDAPAPIPPNKRSEANSDDDVVVRLNDLAAELAGLRTETRSELGHLGRLIRTEGVRISKQLASEIADIKQMLVPSRQQSGALTRWHLAIAQVAGAVLIVVFLKTML